MSVKPMFHVTIVAPDGEPPSFESFNTKKEVIAYIKEELKHTCDEELEQIDIRVILGVLVEVNIGVQRELPVTIDEKVEDPPVEPLLPPDVPS